MSGENMSGGICLGGNVRIPANIGDLCSHPLPRTAPELSSSSVVVINGPCTVCTLVEAGEF